ncbi:hypothetical protein AKG11_28310 [Shinella sp. SUS2]|uniref:hypothetical protein n=1 Tax=unclassified Shinella TaxID=2643062 RepID=UPI0006826F92|nr:MULTISPECIES: hypothetical protein [unclassified Shinella]KNY13639.1 hypothetical protein AKG11_28310 [Shinella sp. SUS2]KOC72532.1 hypothetical protein AKG10_27175 [Shinella sp. GWS1]
MAGKISIIGQISEIDREIKHREKLYPRLVHEGRMKQVEAEMLMERIYAIRQTLVFCKDNEADIRAYIAAKKAGELP